MRFTEERLERVCAMIGAPNWRPTIDDEDRDVVLATLGLCESNLECMYALGAAFRLEFLGMAPVRVVPCITTIAGRLWRGLWLLEPWDNFRCPRCQNEGGPSGLIIVPQVSLQGRVWDFGLVVTDDNGATDGTLLGLLEVDGYRVHRGNRRWDAKKRSTMANAGVPVFACYEETHTPDGWLDALIHHYWSTGLWPAAADCPGARACEVFLPTANEAA